MSEQPNHDEEGKEILHLREADDHHLSDKINIPVSSDDNIKISFLQFFKYSRFIQHEYPQNDIIDKIASRLQQFQSSSNIKKENIFTFFKLLEDEQIEVSSDQYCDLCKLSEIFEVDSLQKLLYKYLENHSQNVDLMINLMIDQISSENFDFFSKNQFSAHIEKCMNNNIDKFIANENFGKLPCSTIYRIFEKSDNQQISSDVLYDFISKQINERFLFFFFLNIKKLSDEKFNDMCSQYIDLKDSDSIRYFDYLKIDLEYIKELKDDIQKLKNQNKMLSEKNNHFQIEQEQFKKQNSQFQNQINELEMLKNQLQTQINKLANENKEIKEQNEKMKDEKSQLQLQINKLNTENHEINAQKQKIGEEKNQLEIQINKLTKENDEIQTQKQKLKQEKNELEVQIKNYIKEINEIEMQKQQLDNEKSQLQLQISKLTKKNNEINEEKIQLQSQMNKLEEYKKINLENSEKEMHKYFELIKILLSYVSDIEKICISGIYLFFREQSCIMHAKQEILNLLNILSH